MRMFCERPAMNYFKMLLAVRLIDLEIQGSTEGTARRQSSSVKYTLGEVHTR